MVPEHGGMQARSTTYEAKKTGLKRPVRQHGHAMEIIPEGTTRRPLLQASHYGALVATSLIIIVVIVIAIVRHNLQRLQERHKCFLIVYIASCKRIA